MGAGLAVDFIGENIYLYAQYRRCMAEWRKGPEVKSYGRNERAVKYNAINIALYSDSTLLPYTMDGDKGTGKEVREAIKNMTDGCHGKAKGMPSLQDMVDDLMTEYEAPGGTFDNQWSRVHHSSHTGQRVRVIVWSGNGLTTNNNDMRLKGTRPEDDGTDYVKLTKEVMRQARQLVDLQVELAHREGSYMVVLGLGDAASWGLDPDEGSYGALNVLASRVPARVNRRIDH